MAPLRPPWPMRGGGPVRASAPPSDATMCNIDKASLSAAGDHTKITWLNIRGVRSKDELLVRTATEQQWPLVLLTETKLKRDREKLYCGQNNAYSWILGSGQRLSRDSAPGKGGVGVLVHSSIRGSIHKLESTRDQLWLRLDDSSHSSGGAPVFVGVVYLPSGSDANVRAECARIYEELAERVQKYQSRGTVLLGGDMNARIAANGDRVTNQAGVQMTEFCQRNGLLIANTQLPTRDNLPRCSGSFSRVELRSDGLQQSTVDYVLVSKSAQAQVASLSLDQAVPHRVLSDHKPLVLEWTGRLSSPSRQSDDVRVRWRVDDICADRRAKARMQAAMHTAMRDWHQEASDWTRTQEYRGSPAQIKVTGLLASWEYRLNHVLADTIGAKHVQQRAKSWVKGGDLLQMIRERDRLRERCETAASAAHRRQSESASDSDIAAATCGSEWESLSAQALHAQRMVRKEIHRRKRAQREQTFATVEQEWSHPKLFFRRVVELRSDGASGISAPVLRNPSGELCSEHESRMEITRQHYAVLGTDERQLERGLQYRSRPNDPGPLEHIEAEEEFDSSFARHIEMSVERLAKESLAQAPTALDLPWTEDEFDAALQRLRNGKAPGPDNIHAEFLRYGGPELHRALRLLFNEILLWEVWPERWCLGLVCPIYKRAGDEAELDNYRPITLLSIASKLFEVLLNSRLTEWAEANRVLCDEQGGFRTKRGCADQLFILKEVWSSRREQRLPTYAAFLDVKSAYDRVWRDGLWHQLYQCGVRGKAWRMIRAMYERMQRVVLVDGKRSAPFSVEVGVSQGSVLSPFLYSVFIDGLIRQLKADESLGVRVAGVQLTGLLYADDIALLAPDPVVLQRMLDIASRYALQWRFHFNGRKSQIVVNGTEQTVAEAHTQEWRLDGQRLSVVPEYKYLGVEAGRRPDRGPNRSFGERLVHSASHRAHDLMLSGCEMNELDARCSSRLWSSLCRPLLEYGCEVWRPNQGQCKQLEQVQGWFARRVLGCSQSTPAVFATSELGLRSLELRREQHQLRYWRRLCAALPERLLSRVFRQRVRDVKVTPLLAKHSLCHMLRETLTKYGLEDEWELVVTDQLFEAAEWESKVAQCVRTEEATTRQVALAARSSLDSYASALLPELGHMAPYLLHSRNCEGAWIQCRLRADCLPLMQSLARQCRPQRSDAHATCLLCPLGANEGAVEGVTHFLSDCQSLNLIELRKELCGRLQQAISEWQQEQRDVWAKEWAQLQLPLSLPTAANSAELSARSRAAEPRNGVASITATIRAMELQLRTATLNAETSREWSELLLGRRKDSGTGLSWDTGLLQRLQSHTQNFLMLAWRARAAQLGGVPTLLPAGRGITMVPYQRMKAIGVRPTSGRRSAAQ